VHDWGKGRRDGRRGEGMGEGERGWGKGRGNGRRGGDYEWNEHIAIFAVLKDQHWFAAGIHRGVIRNNPFLHG